MSFVSSVRGALAGDHHLEKAVLQHSSNVAFHAALKTARGFLALLVLLFLALGAAGPVRALEPLSVSKDEAAIDLTNSVELHLRQSGSLKVSTAPDRDGIVRRIEVRPKLSEDVSNWAVFALSNDSNEQIDRLVVAPHYRLVGSGVFWPDLDAQRIASITPSEGFSLEAREDREADVFLITLDPGAVITLIAELKSPTLPKLYLWEPDAYKDTINSYTLYRGIVLGISGLLAVFLTILFVVKGSAMFPATAALAWGVLAYVCVDFGFWDRVVELSSTGAPLWRAGVEVFLAAALLIFLYAYLNLNRWHTHFSTVAIGWLLGLILLLGVTVTIPEVASGIARLSFAATLILGALMIGWMAVKGYDRAVMLIPTWILALAWLLGAWLTTTGALSNDIVQPALSGGLVLIVMLLGFTVMQHAFAGGMLAEGIVSDVEQQALALTGSGDMLFDWDASRDFIHTGEEAAHILGLPDRMLNAPAKNWLNLVHPNDRERFRATLDAVADHKRGRIAQTFRLRSDAGHYHWFRLKARPLLGTGGELIRCVGTISDVTDAKNSEERMLHDSIHDQSDGAGKPHAVPKPAGHGDGAGAARDQHAPIGVPHQHRRLSRAEFAARLWRRRHHPADGGAPAQPLARSGRQPGAARRRPFRHVAAVGNRAGPDCRLCRFHTQDIAGAAAICRRGIPAYRLHRHRDADDGAPDTA